MPVCFQLIEKGSDTPSVLSHVDDEMRLHFIAEPDPDHWFGHWFDTIGLRLACGKTFDQIRAEFQGYITEQDPRDETEFYENLIKIVDYLDARYTTNSFYSSHKG